MELISLPMRVAGIGAVSPAGWGAGALVAAVRAGQPLPYEEIRRAPGAPVQRVRRVPRSSSPVPFAREPRVRRTSPITGWAVAAALEALGPERATEIREGTRRIGVIMVMLNGCVAFSRRFFGEALDNPATASPLIFPETVFNAPSSHLAALLGAGDANDTLVGDTAQFPAAFDLAALWLELGELDGVLVAAAEEADWVSGEAVTLIDRSAIVAEGAGALYFERSPTPGAIWQRPVPVGPTHSRRAAAVRVREAWREAGCEGSGLSEARTLLCDGLVGAPRSDAAEVAAFADWHGPRVSAGKVLGDGLGARAVWQCVVAAAAVEEGVVDRALVPAIGTIQQALGVTFRRTTP